MIVKCERIQVKELADGLKRMIELRETVGGY